MKKAIYKPTNQNTIIINEFDAYCEILLEGERLQKEKMASLKALKASILDSAFRGEL